MFHNLSSFTIIAIAALIIIIVAAIIFFILQPKKGSVAFALKSIERSFKKIEKRLDTNRAEKLTLLTIFNPAKTLLEEAYNSPVDIYCPTALEYRKCKKLQQWAAVLLCDIEQFSFVSE